MKGEKESTGVTRTYVLFPSPIIFCVVDWGFSGYPEKHLESLKSVNCSMSSSKLPATPFVVLFPLLLSPLLTVPAVVPPPEDAPEVVTLSEHSTYKKYI